MFAKPKIKMPKCTNEEKRKEKKSKTILDGKLSHTPTKKNF